MPAMACVDAAVPPGYAFAWDGSLPAPGAFPGGTPAMATTPTSVTEQTIWSTDLSAALYKINGWGAPYFVINAKGNISVRPFGSATLPHQEIDLMKVVKKASDPKSMGGLGLQLPIIIRLPDVLKTALNPSTLPSILPSIPTVTILTTREYTLSSVIRIATS
ncbi:hypothetical protein HPP92_020248 [Vanilla planifolia]|uniref:Arginine decarboxylase n=1 Tax=Vanilla planifolia TaxID=51239 RepID=A0A835UGT2_VANPL|nr:hypothetical protein HPP92_020657 [Vanilla planifolia]KAG0461772.1 hypothetical protein HPP92_020248 [Vanilla planifolia]